ncbi:CrcB-like protein-domain-containing protein [Thelonectria olida]|uniref:CrcB-like protein-domain-containing protein n=1 Tax=Thelonectria olida TaxID=1576542 RepID=A0A9P8WBY5_9HYPO|nr:CrcB-like protein-domain-containing protein [Thelonectria olida]
MDPEPPSRHEAGVYDAPESYQDLDELEAIPPVDESPVRPSSVCNAPDREPHELAPTGGPRRRSSVYNAPESYQELNELAVISPVSNIPSRSEPGLQLDTSGGKRDQPERQQIEEIKVSRLATQIYTHSYLVFFAILGTVARLGLTALTHYPGTPVIFNTVWSNFTGSLIMGFLTEDRKLFRYEWGTPTYHQAIERAKQKARDEEDGSGSSYVPVDLKAAKKAHLATKKTIPLYIGLATGFCGSFTTFSSFIKDVFLALANEMPTPGVSGSPVSRNGGYSFMAMLAVVIATISLSLSGLFVGAHLAIGLERVMPSIPFALNRKVLDPFAVLLGWGCWLGAVLLSIFPPHESWRGQATFSLVFAPLGCLARFYLSLHLNGKVATFPMGTFAANVLGTVLLGMAWDIAHVPIGGAVGCQVLQGIEDGFCGCLTTISTWVSELSSLRRRSAWLYGMASVVVSLALMIAVMGGLRWSEGYSTLSCVTSW